MTDRSIEELVAEAERRIAASPTRNDPATVLAMALEMLAEEWAADQRPLCPVCGKRRVDRNLDRCPWCRESEDAQLLYKRQWWRRAGGAEAQRERRTAVANPDRRPDAPT